jgi:hypothetical protein
LDAERLAWRAFAPAVLTLRALVRHFCDAARATSLRLRAPYAAPSCLRACRLRRCRNTLLPARLLAPNYYKVCMVNIQPIF